MEKLRHGSLFSGIGGFDLAAEWMGWENVFHCEWNEFGQKVLKHYWPQAESFSDITKTDFTKYYGTVDIITGGFPCQPYSSAGKRRGKEDERHLWPEMLRAIREVSPRFVVGENVRGLTNWNGGLVFDEVCAELESLGYQVAPVIIPACGVGAPHKRERIWFVAYNDSKRQQGYEQQIGNRRDSENPEQWVCICKEQGRNEIRCINEGDCKNRNATNATGFGFCGNGATEQSQPKTFGTWDRMGEKNATDSECFRLEHSTTPTQVSRKEKNSNGERSKSTLFTKTNDNGHKSNWNNFPTESPICSGNDGFSSKLDGITFRKWRAESIKAYGNAIVPQVAYQIFKALEKSLYL